jgi:anti-sigma regulatory factor (Ser/Thr protein kinase)
VSLHDPTRGPLSITLPPDIDAPGRARRFAVDAARSLESGPALDEAGIDALKLLVSEVVANVVVHARTSMRVRAYVAPGCVRVEVSDDLPPDPQVRASEGDAFGLRLVEALASRWGVAPMPHGKVVWFEIGDPRANGAGAAGPHGN